MNIAQYGSTAALTTSPVYGSVDRWSALQLASANGAFSQASVTGLVGFSKGFKLQRTNTAATTGTIKALYVFETANSLWAQGKSVTISFWAKAGANFSAASNDLSAIVYSGKGTDQSAATITTWTTVTTPISQAQAITTSFVRYSFTGTIPSDCTQLGIEISYVPVGTAGADDSVTVTGVQLEEGAVATPFEHKHFAEEILLCRRYARPIIRGVGQATSSTVSNHYYDVSNMRATPTLSTTAGWNNTASDGTPGSSAPTAGAAVNGDITIATITTGLSAGNATVLIPPTGALFIAEL
jgi:hypothetical protein